jgi:hypothetical protein
LVIKGIVEIQGGASGWWASLAQWRTDDTQAIGVYHPPTCEHSSVEMWVDVDVLGHHGVILREITPAQGHKPSFLFGGQHHARTPGTSRSNTTTQQLAEIWGSLSLLLGIGTDQPSLDCVMQPARFRHQPSLPSMHLRENASTRPCMQQTKRVGGSGDN